MWATAQNVVPRSIPTAFLADFTVSEVLMDAAQIEQNAEYVPLPGKHSLLRTFAGEGDQKSFLPLLDYYFFWTEDATFPGKAAFHPASRASTSTINSQLCMTFVSIVLRRSRSFDGVPGDNFAASAPASCPCR